MRSSYKFKIDRRLSAAKLAKFERLARSPRETIDSVTAWVRAAGVDVSRSAVHRRMVEAQNRPLAALLAAVPHVTDRGLRRSLQTYIGSCRRQLDEA